MQWSPNEGGVCDNCGMPGLVHDADSDRCPDEIVLAGYASRVAAWFAIVAPAREAHYKARRHAKSRRRQLRREGVSEAEVELAERRRDELLIEYRAAIRRADREA